MKTIILGLMLLFTTLNAAQTRYIRAYYDISYAIFGKIGEVEATLEQHEKSYSIDIRAEATGIAKLMSNRRIEKYHSEGSVVGGLLRPKRFSVTTLKGKYYKATHSYLFDHQAKKVLHETSITQKEGSIQKEEVLEYYAKDDILTLFFNLGEYLQNVCSSGTCSLVAVGANEKDGKVDIHALGGGNFKVILHRRIFASKQGEMSVHINNKGVCDRALLKDVVFFGDVKAKTTKIVYQK